MRRPARTAPGARGPVHPPAYDGWPWIALLGAGMLLGGLLTGWVGLTRVVLPYDEAFVGLTRDALAAVNPHLLAFMAHDRLTLAGTMISLGVLYGALALFPLRRGAAWAWDTLLLSGGLGFVSFFLYLGYGYFDPLHAAVTLLLLLLFALGMVRRPRAEGLGEAPDSVNDARSRRGTLGRWLFVVTGFGLVAAGATIALVGMFFVFVPQDLAYMHTTAAALRGAAGRLVALIAHDRTSFGGVLASDGVAVLLCALWGFRRGARWLWWTLFAAGAPGFAATLGIHAHIGYTDASHLAPAYLGLGVYAAALVLSYGFLNDVGPRAAPPWSSALSSALQSPR